ncbi:MAG: hypothetical protein ABEJ96_00445, partial [Thiohalorhabdaceae bacterium]
DRVEDFEPIIAEHAELIADTDETKECGICGGTTVRIELPVAQAQVEDPELQAATETQGKVGHGG